jgi:hypothetical protein
MKCVSDQTKGTLVVCLLGGRRRSYWQVNGRRPGRLGKAAEGRRQRIALILERDQPRSQLPRRPPGWWIFSLEGFRRIARPGRQLAAKAVDVRIRGSVIRPCTASIEWWHFPQQDPQQAPNKLRYVVPTYGQLTDMVDDIKPYDGGPTPPHRPRYPVGNAGTASTGSPRLTVPARSTTVRLADPGEHTLLGRVDHRLTQRIKLHRTQR